jgi:hypothetical protein
MVVDAHSLPSTVTVTASTTSVPSSSNISTSYPALGDALAKSEQHVRRINSVRKYQTRKHIYDDVVRILSCSFSFYLMPFNTAQGEGECGYTEAA